MDNGLINNAIVLSFRRFPNDGTIFIMDIYCIAVADAGVYGHSMVVVVIADAYAVSEIWHMV